ncbi:hypothetical protein QJQ45_025827, partial [Haematococcus lacustris]
MKYEDELIEDLKQRTTPDAKPEKPLRKVSRGLGAVRAEEIGIRKIASVNPGAYGLRGKKRVVVLRTAGAIVGRSTGTGATITPDSLIPVLRSLAKDKGVAAVILRVDSPGGDALASDLMWREIKKLGMDASGKACSVTRLPACLPDYMAGEKKPVIASMADVAASGGYYLSMAAHKIVAEPLTITGSIGVVTGKFNLAELYGKIGYAKELISRGKYAQVLADNRPFNTEEADLFAASAQHAYESFRDKAAASRGMSIPAMQQVAQGRVWTGRDALQRGLVDALGGVHAAVELAKAAAGIEAGEKVTVQEVGRARPSPLALLRGGAAAAMALAAHPQAAAGTPSVPSLLGVMLAPLLAGLQPGMDGVAASGSAGMSGMSAAVGSAGLQGVASSLGPGAAEAVAAAYAVGALSSPFGLSFSAEPESLCVMASGSSMLNYAHATDDEGEQAASEDETGSVAETHPAHPTQPASDAPGTSVKKSRKRAPTTFDIDKDPVSWFYQNQIKCEEEFQAKKDALREEARKRLDQIMDKKNKRLMWPSDSEFDDLSISSGELSELDSDVHSLTSLRSCALSWLENSKYGRPAEACLRWAALAGLAASGIGMILSYVAVKAGQKLPGAVKHSEWATYAFLAAVLLSSGGGLAMLACNWRSKRLLLGAQVLHTIAYGVTAFITVMLWVRPIAVDGMIYENACKHSGKKERAMKLCQLLPIVKAEAAESGANLLWGLVVMGLLALVLLAVGAWYTLE